MNDRIKWNTKKHDTRTAMSDRERAKHRIGKIFADWKIKLTTTRRVKVEDLVPKTRELKEQITKILKEVGLFEDEYGKKTLELLDDKISDIMAVEMAGKIVDKQTAFINILTRFLPERPDQQPQTPEVFEFRTAEELTAIPFVKKLSEQEGFVGILRDANKLLALYENSETILLGAVSTRVGLDNIPTVGEFKSAIGRKKK